MNFDQYNLEKIAFNALAEIDLYLFDKKYTDFYYVKKLSTVLEENQLQDTDQTFSLHDLKEYVGLWEAIKKNSPKEINKFSELALEMKLLTYELRDVPNLKETRLRELSSFLNDFSKELNNNEKLLRLKSRRSFPPVLRYAIGD